MTGMIRSELFRIVRRRMLPIMAVLIVSLTILIYGLITGLVEGGGATGTDAQVVTDFERALRVDSVPPFGDDIVWQLVGIMGVILVSTSIGNEFTWRTVLTLTTWTGARARLVLAKLVVVLWLLVGGVALGFVTCLLASTVIEAARGELRGQLSARLLADVALAALLTWIAIVPYVLLAGALTLLARSTALGIALGIAVMFLEELAVTLIDQLGDSLDWVKNLTMNWNVNAVLAPNGSLPGVSPDVETGLPSPWRGALLLLLFSLGYVATMLSVFQRRDVDE